MKRVGQSFYILTVFSLILADIIVIYLSFVIIYGNLLKYVAVTAQLWHKSTLSHNRGRFLKPDQCWCHMRNHGHY